jgi:hypothetical protein
MAIQQYPGTPDAVPDHPNQNILANPSTVSGSSIESPPDYPSNPAQAPNQSESVGRGIPAKSDFVSMGAILMQPCLVCGRAWPPDEFGAHLQSHSESPFMREGSDFGNRNDENYDEGY